MDFTGRAGLSARSQGGTPSSPLIGRHGFRARSCTHYSPQIARSVISSRGIRPAVQLYVECVRVCFLFGAVQSGRRSWKMMKHWVRSSKALEQHMTLHRKLGRVAEIVEKYKNPRLGGRKKPGTSRAAVGRKASQQKRRLFFRAIKTCTPQRLGSVRKPPAEVILAEGDDAAGKTVTRQTETISTNVRAAFIRSLSLFLLFSLCWPTESRVLVSGATV